MIYPLSDLINSSVFNFPFWRHSLSLHKGIFTFTKTNKQTKNAHTHNTFHTLVLFSRPQYKCHCCENACLSIVQLVFSHCEQPLLIFCTNRNYDSYCWKMTYLSYHIITYQMTGQKREKKTQILSCWQWNMACHKDGPLLHATLPVRRTMARLDHYLKHVVHEE